MTTSEQYQPQGYISRLQEFWQRIRAGLAVARLVMAYWWPGIRSEVQKALTIAWSYRLNFLLSLALWVLIFLGSVLFAGGGQVTSEQLVSSALGFALTYYAIDLVNAMSSELSTEAQVGTLEQVYMSIVPPRILLLAKMAAALAVSTCGLVLAGLALIFLASVEIPLRLEAIPVVVATWIGLFGMGLIIASGTLLFKQVGPVSSILTRVLLFVNGTFIALDTLGSTAYNLGRLVPTAQGIIVLRKVVLEGYSLVDVFIDGSALFLIVYSVVLFAIGWWICGWAEDVMRQRGTLGQF